MKEAVELVGLFIDKGPVSILKRNTSEVEILKDYKRGSLFTKPLLVMVNSQSASASELFAGAMQDYNRATIVGSTTFGKSSSQIILPLKENKNIGYCKVTSAKFYRITGNSHQELGVKPDITLPSLFDGFEIGEKYYKYYLKNNSIDKELKYQVFNKTDYSTILNNSKERVSKSILFQKIAQSETSITNFANDIDKTFPLKISEIKTDIEKTKSIFAIFYK